MGIWQLRRKAQLNYLAELNQGKSQKQTISPLISFVLDAENVLKSAPPNQSNWIVANRCGPKMNATFVLGVSVFVPPNQFATGSNQ